MGFGLRSSLNIDITEPVDFSIIVESMLNQDVDCFSELVLSLCSSRAAFIDVVVGRVIVLHPTA